MAEPEFNKWLSEDSDASMTYEECLNHEIACLGGEIYYLRLENDRLREMNEKLRNALAAARKVRRKRKTRVEE